MKTPLDLFIHHRRKEIAQQIQALNDELAQLDRAESAAGASSGDAAIETLRRVAGSVPRRPRGEMSIKDLILDVLKDRPLGATANEIIEMIAAKHHEQIPRTSISPQLSRLKTDEDVILDGTRWKPSVSGALKGILE